MEGKNDAKTQSAIEKKLSKVKDPETGLDVMRMGFIRNLDVSRGRVSLLFRPSSPVCPPAFRLGADIREAVLSVTGVERVDIRVENFNRAGELERLLAGQGSALRENETTSPKV